jgi:chemotaxis protein methyltransferase CheR
MSSLIEHEEPGKESLIRYLCAKTGVRWEWYRQGYLLRRIEGRMRHCRSHSYDEYLRYLRANPEESRLLTDTIGVNVTEFFRDGDVYDALSGTVLPAVLAAKKAAGSRTVRIWSTCCATGEEPYSLAISIAELLEKDDDFRVTIFATDIDAEAMAAGQRGTYAAEKLKAVSGRRLSSFFTRPAKETYRVRDEIRSMVSFRRHDLISDVPLSLMDLTVCRNMLIYVQDEYQETIFRKLHDSLVHGGCLVLGKTERMPPACAGLFKEVNLPLRMYAKI